MTSSIDLIHPSIHLCIWPPFLDLVLWPLPSLKASLFILGGLCSAMGCGHEANALIRAFSSGVTALSTSQLDSSATVTHTASVPTVLSQASPAAADPGLGSERAPPPVSGGVLPRPPCLVHGPCHELCLQPLCFLHQMAVVVIHPFIPSSLHSFTIDKHFFKLASAILERAPKDSSPIFSFWKTR